jgi:hypothetical protein
MARRLPPPRDPVGLASLVAALRAYVRDASPRGDFDSEIRSKLDQSKLNQELAERMVRNFESIDTRVRQKALGDLDDPSFVPVQNPLRAGTRGPPPRPGSSTALIMPRTEVLDPNLGVTLINPDRPPPDVRSYTIRYVGFHCESERGDYGWSDEVYLSTVASHIAPNGENVTRKEHHPIDRSEYGDVDAGDTRLGPIAACWQGLSDPMNLTAAAYEHDQGDPTEMLDFLEAVVIVALAYVLWEYAAAEINEATAGAILAAAGEKIEDGAKWLLGFGDDLTGVRTLTLPLATLEAFGRRGKRRHAYEVIVPGLDEPILIATDLTYHFRTRHGGGGARYVFGYDVVRDPPFPPVVPGID